MQWHTDESKKYNDARSKSHTWPYKINRLAIVSTSDVSMHDKKELCSFFCLRPVTKSYVYSYLHWILKCMTRELQEVPSSNSMCGPATSSNSQLRNQCGSHAWQEMSSSFPFEINISSSNKSELTHHKKEDDITSAPLWGMRYQRCLLAWITREYRASPSPASQHLKSNNSELRHPYIYDSDAGGIHTKMI